MTHVGKIRELRELAGLSLHEAAGLLEISYSKMWSAEAGYAKLTERQEQKLEEVYSARIRERLKRVSLTLTGELHA